MDFHRILSYLETLKKDVDNFCKTHIDSDDNNAKAKILRESNLPNINEYFGLRYLINEKYYIKTRSDASNYIKAIDIVIKNVKIRKIESEEKIAKALGNFEKIFKKNANIEDAEIIKYAEALKQACNAAQDCIETNKVFFDFSHMQFNKEDCSSSLVNLPSDISKNTTTDISDWKINMPKFFEFLSKQKTVFGKRLFLYAIIGFSEESLVKFVNENNVPDLTDFYEEFKFLKGLANYMLLQNPDKYNKGWVHLNLCSCEFSQYNKCRSYSDTIKLHQPDNNHKNMEIVYKFLSEDKSTPYRSLIFEILISKIRGNENKNKNWVSERLRELMPLYFASKDSYSEFLERKFVETEIKVFIRPFMNSLFTVLRNSNYNTFIYHLLITENLYFEHLTKFIKYKSIDKENLKMAMAFKFEIFNFISLKKYDFTKIKELCKLLFNNDGNSIYENYSWDTMSHMFANIRKKNFNQIEILELYDIIIKTENSVFIAIFIDIFYSKQERT